MSEKNNIPAFPRTMYTGHDLDTVNIRGMSLRDYFAAKAMQGLIAHIDNLEKYFEENSISTREEMTEKVAEISFDFADAFMEKRKK